MISLLSIGLLVLHFYTLATAAPTTTVLLSAPHLASATASYASSLPRTSSTRVQKPIHVSIFHPAPTGSPNVALTRKIPPAAHTGAASGPQPDFHPKHRHARPSSNPMIITFSVLGGLIVSGCILGCIRCCHNYKSTPKRDRIADIVQRHNLQRELEEIERNPGVLRRPSLREPAPPYFPRPPSYDATPTVPSPPAIANTDYSELSTNSPLSSPPAPPMRAIISSSPPPIPAPITNNPGG